MAEFTPPRRNTTHLSDKELYEDFKKAFDRHRVTFSEYFYQYQFWRLTEAERAEFVSISSMQCVYRRLVSPSVRAMFHDKPRFLELWSEFIQRKWMVVSPNVSFDDFVAFISQRDVILKPQSGTRGNGIRKILHDDNVDHDTLYKECLHDGTLIEECIVGHPAIQIFHEASLNTIRVVTFRTPKAIVVIGAFMRVGRGGHVFDNAHAGGIFSQINVESGIIESNGIDVDGNEYERHPETNHQFKGVQIPQWNDCKEACCKAAAKYDDVIVVGWDVCVNRDGKVEIVEGNHAPDIDVMQSPLKIGKKRYYQSLLDNYGLKLK